MSEYPISTLHDMSSIPEEALGRFLTELPKILDEVRAMKGVINSFNDTSEGMVMHDHTVCWVDEDSGKSTVTFSIDAPVVSTRAQFESECG